MRKMMKPLLRVMAIFCCFLMLAFTAVACDSGKSGGGGPQSGIGAGSEEETPGGGGEDETPGGEDEQPGGGGDEQPGGEDEKPGGGDEQPGGETPNLNLPQVHVTTENGDMWFAQHATRENKGDYIGCTVTVDNCEEKYELTELAAQIKARGNYTVNYEKKPFRIKFNKKQNMLGLNGGSKFKNWLLLADYKDVSMIRNSLAFYLGGQLLGEDGYYCSDFTYVEVYLNNQYWGMYMLCEQQEAKRVDVPEPEDAEGNDYLGTDIGYLVEMDGYYFEEDPLESFPMDHRIPKAIDNSEKRTQWGLQGDGIGYTIKSDILSQQQHDFIQNYVKGVYDICYEATRYEIEHTTSTRRYMHFNDDYTALVEVDDYSSVNEQELIEAVVDVDSLVDMYILSEICCDYDIGWSSFYMSVDMSASGNKKLTFHAPWDFDSAFGLREKNASGTGLCAAVSDNPWLLMLIREKWFQNKVHERWMRAKADGMCENALKMIKEYSEKYKDCYAKNYERWNWNSVIRTVGGEYSQNARRENWQNEGQAADYLYRWVSTRFEFMDQYWGDNGDYLQTVKA